MRRTGQSFPFPLIGIVTLAFGFLGLLSSLSVAAINMEAAPHKGTDTDTTNTDTDTNEESQMRHRMNYDESTYRSE